VAMYMVCMQFLHEYVCLYACVKLTYTLLSCHDHAWVLGGQGGHPSESMTESLIRWVVVPTYTLNSSIWSPPENGAPPTGIHRCYYMCVQELVDVDMSVGCTHVSVYVECTMGSILNEPFARPAIIRGRHDI